MKKLLMMGLLCMSFTAIAQGWGPIPKPDQPKDDKINKECKKLEDSSKKCEVLAKGFCENGYAGKDLCQMKKSGTFEQCPVAWLPGTIDECSKPNATVDSPLCQWVLNHKSCWGSQWCNNMDCSKLKGPP